MTDRNFLTATRKALIDRLGTIQTRGGYFTDAGFNVRSGWLNEELRSDTVGYPLIVVQRYRGRQPDANGPGIKLHRGFLVVGAVPHDLPDYEEALEDLELDLLRCLMPEHGRRTSWLPPEAPTLMLGAPEPGPPTEAASVATVIIPVYPLTLIDPVNLFNSN
ncbi:hypothetical protein PSGK_21100 [Pseudomonas solani]|uniref:hypothetical protein n=1 Tax=Pseudomonas solani TaxID=2731552 RepID=UPI0035BE5970